MLSLGLTSFLVRLEVKAEVGVVGSSLEEEEDLGFFLSDRIGELDDPKDRGLLEDPSESDFLEEEEEKKSLFLKTMVETRVW